MTSAQGSRWNVNGRKQTADLSGGVSTEVKNSSVESGDTALGSVMKLNKGEIIVAAG